MHYEINIDAFQGPFDLLWHLIKKAELDIHEIELVALTAQYLEYIETQEALNLSIAGEYLVMAAELIELKSRSLLPVVVDSETKEPMLDPKEELINRLLEYKRYQAVSSTFKVLAREREKVYTKLPMVFKVEGGNEITQELDVNDLWEALLKWQARKEAEKPLSTSIVQTKVSVVKVIKQIQTQFKIKSKLMLKELFQEWTRPMLVVTFLAILEMVCRGELSLQQDCYLGEIYLEKQGCE